LEPVESARHDSILLSAVFFGQTRLIDNMRVE
jgi:pantothenate synthetase